MRYAIKSRKLGTEFVFSCNCESQSAYIFLEGKDINGQYTRHQICNGGKFYGNTLMASSKESFKRQAKSWYQKHISDN